MKNAEAVNKGAQEFNKAEFTLAEGGGNLATLQPCYDYVSATSVVRKWGTDCTATNKTTYKTAMCVAANGSACYDDAATALVTANITCKTGDASTGAAKTGRANCILIEYANSIF